MTAAPVHLLWGEDDFLLREAALEILGDVRPREVDAGEWVGGELADLATPSLFGEARALLVSDARSLPADGVAQLAAYLTAPDPSAPLILLLRVGDRGKPPASLVKVIEPVGRVRQVKLARKDLPGWVVSRATSRRLDLAPDGAAALVEIVGEDPGTLDQAAEQLAAAFPGERIDRSAVARQFRGLGDQHVWDLCDRAFSRDLSGAMRSLQVLLGGLDDPLMILGGLASRLRDLMRVRSLPERLPAAEIAKRAGLRFDWQARRCRDQASCFSAEELVTVHARVVEADRALKSGATGDVVLPVLVAEIAGTPALV